MVAGLGRTCIFCRRVAVCVFGSSDLPFDQFLEYPVDLLEFVEGAALHDFSGLQHVDAIGLFQRGQAVGNDEPGGSQVGQGSA